MNTNYAKMVHEYLVHSYLYYILDESIVSDEYYDDLCRTLAMNWEKLDDYERCYVNYEDLKAGTGYNIRAYPNGVASDARKRLASVRKDRGGTVPYADRGVTTNQKELYEVLKEAGTRLLKGMAKDYHYFLEGDHRYQCLQTIKRILEERNDE